MSASSRVSKALSIVLPGGALGASVVLALGSAQAAAAISAGAAAAPNESVSQRLRAIREGVAELAAGSTPTGSAEVGGPGGTGATPTWWGNGGWGRWHMGWGNGGFGWPNWHNWGNGWHNWGNGWHNFWHNW